MNAIEARGLEKRYGRVRALDGVDLAIPSGSAVLVAGPNGAGKSTLLRVLAGLARPTRGSVEVLGEPLYTTAGRRVRGRIGFLGAESGLYPELSVRENLRFCARLLGASAARVETMLEALDLVGRGEQPVRTLSQGYRRRAGLARALLAEPELLLLDEPWNGLDADAADRLDGLLRNLRGRGPTLLVAAHATESTLFDKTLSLRAGALVS